MLRQRLLEIVNTLPLLEHAAQIENLRCATRHNIVVKDSPHPIERYTCAVHAFSLVENPTYVEIASFGLGSTYAGPEFIAYLLEQELLSHRAEGEVTEHDLIFYFERGVFRHVGRLVAPTRVLSKWGKGLLYEHDTWEVPENYGNEVRYFVGPDGSEAFALFKQYAEHKGFAFTEPDA
jgi:hypothetical protein